MEQKKLYKGKPRILCGVCSGIAEYFGCDPTIVRLALVVLCLLGFSGLLLYIIAAIIMPEPPQY